MCTLIVFLKIFPVVVISFYGLDMHAVADELYEKNKRDHGVELIKISMHKLA